ncbi:hypothetical protein TNCV_3539191 [Trichonephila clavipes]|nr:hypothetical protein TNCV_3539191 [Trichonephila clavipes]
MKVITDMSGDSHWKRADPAFTITHDTDPQPGVRVWVLFRLISGPLWSSLKAHFQHSGNVDDWCDNWRKFGKKYRRRASGSFITLCRRVAACIQARGGSTLD